MTYERGGLGRIRADAVSVIRGPIPEAVCYIPVVSLPEAVWFALLSVGLPAVLIGQQAPDEVQIPEGARDVKSTIIVVDGKTVWKITAVIDEEVPPILAGESLPTIDLQNVFGAVRVHVRSVQELQLQAHGHRTLSADDVVFARDGASFRIRATPPDGAQVNLDLTIPYGYLLRAETIDGDISYEGLGKAELRPSTGAVSLRVPQELTSFELSSLRAPAMFEGQAEVHISGDGWTARDRLPEWLDGYAHTDASRCTPTSRGRSGSN